MEEEKILTGYCRCIDSHRMVTAEWEDGQWTADCNYANCPYRQSCDIAKGIEEE